MTTFAEHMAALKAATAAGDVEAAAIIRQRAVEAQREEDRARYAPEAGGFVTQLRSNIGAGMHRAAQGVGQLVGLSTPAEVREHDKLREQLAEQSFPGAGAVQFAGEILPTVALPGGMGAGLLPKAASAFTRIAAPTAAAGAAQGLISPTTDESTIGGKLTNAAIGAVAGPAVGLTAQRVLPGAVSKAREIAAGTLGGIGEWRNWPSWQALSRKVGAEKADEMIAGMLKADKLDPQDALAAMRTGQRTAAIPGAELPPAAVIPSPELKQLHHTFRETGGDVAKPLRTQEAASNRARAQYLREGLETTGPGRTAGAVQSDINELYNVQRPKAPTPNPQALDSPDVLKVLAAEANQQRGRVRDELVAMADRYQEFRGLAVESGRWQDLDKFRKEVLADTVNRLQRTGESNVADELLAVFNKKVQPELEAVIKRARGGVSGDFFGATSKGHRLLSERDQLAKQQEILDIFETQVGQRTSMGDPLATSGVVEKQIRRLSQNPVNEYGKPLVSGQASRALTQMQAQADALRTLQGTDLGTRGSSTARNILGSKTVLKQAQREGLGMGEPASVGAVGAMLIHPAVAVGVVARALGKTNLARSTSAALVEALSNPQAMERALQNAAKAGAPPAELSAVRNYVNSTIGAGAGAMASQGE